MRLVAAGTEPITEGRHRVRVEPHHGRVIVLLRGPVGLRYTVQRRVLTREQRGATRHACRRARIVTMELQPAITQRLASAEMLLAESRHGCVFVRRGITLF